MDQKCLTRAEVAERYQISEEDVREFEKQHRLPVLRIGINVRYDAKALAAFEAAARGLTEGTPADQLPAAPEARHSPATEAAALFDLHEAASRIGCSTQFLRYHLVKHPTYEDQPTHRRIGRKVMFTAADFDRVVATLADPRFQRQPRGPAVHVPSPLSVERRLKKLLEGAKARGKKPRQR